MEAYHLSSTGHDAPRTDEGRTPDTRRQAMYVYCDSEARFCNRCFSGIAISNTYSENVFVALGIQNAMCKRHFVICDLPGFTIFFSTFLYTARFSKKTLLNMKVVFRFSVQLLFETFLIIRRIERHMNKYEGWNFNSGNYLFTTDTK